MAIRMTGLTSGLDTESIISQLVDAHKTQVDNEKKKQTKLEWKKEAWSNLNSKLYNFYTGALSNFKSSGTYNVKSVSSNVSGKVSFTTSNNAAKGTHSLSVRQVATSAYLTGSKVASTTSGKTSFVPPTADNEALGNIVDSSGNSVDFSGNSFSVSYMDNGSEVTKQITLDSFDSTQTIADVVDNLNAKLSENGIDLTASYDGAKGGFSFENTSATRNEETSTYEGGISYTMKTTGTEVNKLGIGSSSMVVSSKSTSDIDCLKTTSGAVNVVKTDTTANGYATDANTKLVDLGVTSGTTFNITVNGEEKSFTTNSSTTLSGLAAQFSKLGVSASYDATQGRFFVNSTDTGVDKDFRITSSNDAALGALGLDISNGAIKTEASDAVIMYNGAEFKQASNAFSINGLNFTAMDTTATKVVGEDGSVTYKDEQPMTITVGIDSQAVYDSVKNFVTEYNALIKEMNTLYSAKNVSDYEPLTDDEKKSMSDDEVEKWETKIKDSLLRRDDTISNLLSSMRSTLNKSVEVTLSDGTTKKYALSSFGINTGVYTENGLLHINGDKSDSSVSEEDDKLMAAIMSDPEAVMQTLSGLGSEMYKNFQKAMSTSEISSALTFYNDKQYDTDIKNMKDSITKLQDKLTAEEDRYYDQFSAMESAMSKLNSQQSYLSQLIGR